MPNAAKLYGRGKFFSIAGAAMAVWGTAEMDTEQSGVTLARETWDLVTAKKLKGWINQGKRMLIVDTLPFETS